MTAHKIRFEIYVRKSQEPDDRQVLSIPAQVKQCKEKFGYLTADTPIEESQSAKAPGRPLFSALLDRVERGEVQGICAWHPDRLSRNSVDTGRIIYLLDIGKLKDLKFVSYTFENTPEGKWMLAMVMGQAKYQVDKLQVDVIRGNQEKYEIGGITWRAPQGYRNNVAKKTIEPDPDRYAQVRRMWDLLLSGLYTVPEIHRVANLDWGYRTRTCKKSGDRPLALSSVYLLFRNPLYAGLNIRPDGEIYETTHQSMISVDEFWRGQEMLGRNGRAKPKHRQRSAYTDRLITCGECGCSFTVERKRKLLKNGETVSFEYYRCTKKRGRCAQRYLATKELERQIAKDLQALVIASHTLKWLNHYLEERAARESAIDHVVTEIKDRTADAVKRELKVLSVMRRKEHIEEAEFLEQRNELIAELGRLLNRPVQPLGPRWLGSALKVLGFCSACLFSFWKGGVDERKFIVSIITGSHLKVLNKKIEFKAVGSFQLVANHASYVDWCTFAEDIRTYFIEHPDDPTIARLDSCPFSYDLPTMEEANEELNSEV